MNPTREADLLQSIPAPMALALQANFGSIERWRDEFCAMQRDRGTATLALRPSTGALVNAPALAAGDLALLELGSAGIDWPAAYERYQRAIHDASEAYGADADDVPGTLLLDVRRRGMYELSPHTLPGAQWRDPAMVAAWSAELRTDRPVLVYCVYGHEVGRATALRLRAAGVDARFLRGGIDAWQSAGRALDVKATTR